MRQNIAATVVVTFLLTTNHADAVTIDWVTIGNAGNASDPGTGNLYGAVNYEYRIGKYEVTIGQWCDFLNATAKSDPYGLYSTFIASNLNVAGISRSGTSGNYTYAIISPSGATPVGAESPGNRPVGYITWFNAARFANWMHNGQGSGSTETGVYSLVGGQTSGTVPARNANAQFYIPTENEWYKAAYYSPLLNSGSGGYWKYATQSNSAPGTTIGDQVNQANYAPTFGVRSVTNSSVYAQSQNYLTNVGAFTNSASYYGTFDQNGNMTEWNDLDGAAGASRVYRGGNWNNTSASSMVSSNRVLNFPTNISSGLGFRLASPVPEPATSSLALAGVIIASWWCASQRRKARLDLAWPTGSTANEKAIRTWLRREFRADPEPVPPWEWRATEKARTAARREPAER